MKYYEELNVSNVASKMEIKKAYFKRVKQSPPEKYPEEFKKYRKAYEILIDDTARARYDQMNELPTKFKEIYEVALLDMEKEDYESVIGSLKELVKENSKHEGILNLLGDAYFKNNNFGNAVKTFELLVESDSENLDYRIKLANAYVERKFTKKAIVLLEGVLSRDSRNVSSLQMLAEIYENKGEFSKSRSYYEKALKVAKAGQLITLELQIALIFISIKQQKPVNIHKHLKLIEDEVKYNPAYSEEVIESILYEVYELLDSEKYYALKYIVELLEFLSEMEPNHEIVEMIKNQVDEMYLAQTISEDKNIPESIQALIAVGLKDCDCDSCRLEELFLQLQIMEENSVKIANTVKYLKKTYLSIYEQNASFYEKLQNPKLRRQLEIELKKKAQKENEKLILEDDDFYLPNEPYVRQGPKIGRNDPCSCGSGKKYKKCCG